MDIIAIGEPLLEFSAEEEGGLDTAGRYLSGFGGDASNFAVAARRSGASVAMLTRIGSDPFGDAFMRLWKREGLDTSLVERDPERPTGVYFISRSEGSHEFTYYRAGSAASFLHPTAIPLALVRRARLLHFTGVTQGISSSACDAAFAAMSAAREAGVHVSYDPNYRSLLWPLSRARGIIHETASRADLFFPSIDEARILTGLDNPEQVVKFYLGLGAKVVILKLGKEGALMGAGESLTKVAAPAVEAVDASGAGDAFAGAFAACYLEGRSLEDCARFAAVAAALSTLGLGCVGSIPRRKDVLAYIERLNS